MEWVVYEQMPRRIFMLAPLVFVLCLVLTLILVVTIKIHCHRLGPGNGPKNLDSIVVNTVLAVLAAFGIFVDYYKSGWVLFGKFWNFKKLFFLSIYKYFLGVLRILLQNIYSEFRLSTRTQIWTFYLKWCILNCIFWDEWSVT